MRYTTHAPGICTGQIVNSEKINPQQIDATGAWNRNFKLTNPKNEIYTYVSDKTNHGGWIRRVVDGIVKYGVNPEITTKNNSVDTEAILN